MDANHEPRISLCMIARDEARFIGGCIESVKGAVDEVVVADTGSTDGTAELARRAGARVVPFTWCDDFAAARNASIAAASGDWLLILDADERLSAAGAAAVRDAVRRASAPVGMLRLHDASRLDAAPADVISGQARLGECSEIPRLIRHDPDLAYEGVIHEHINAYMTRHARTAMRVGADIVHLGAVPGLRVDRQKRLRNVRLLRRRCESDPLDFDAAGYLAMELYGLTALEEAWHVVEQRWEKRASSSPFGTLRLSLARGLLLFSARRPDDIFATVDFERRRSPGNPELAFLEGCAWELRGWSVPRKSKLRRSHLARAIESFSDAMRPAPGRFRDNIIYGACSWHPLTHIGHALLILGHPAEAMKAFEGAQAVKSEPRAELGLVEAEIALGKPLAALERLEPLLGKFRDAWWLASRASAALGSSADAELFLTRALSDPGDFTAWHRGEALAAEVARGRGKAASSQSLQRRP